MDTRDRRFAAQAPLFDVRLVSVSRDQRSIGEMLRDIDSQARGLLFDVSGDDARALVRGWPDLADAACVFWRALPGRNRDPEFAALDDRPIARLEALTAGLRHHSQSGFAAHTSPHPLMAQWASTLVHAAKLVDRYRAEIPAERPDVRHDLDLTRSQVLHALFITAHAVSVSLHERGRETKADSPNNLHLQHAREAASPSLLGGTYVWAQRMAAIERTLNLQLTETPTTPAAGRNSQGAPDPDDPLRFERASAAWDIHAHRVLARYPTAAHIHLICRTQAMLALTAIGQLDTPTARAHVGATDRVELAAALERSSHAWSELAGRWRDLCSPTDLLAPTLAGAASELRAAANDTTIDRVRPQTGASSPAADERSFSTLRACLTTIDAGPELAHAIHTAGAASDLTGPARSLSRRANDDVEREIRGGLRADIDTVWVLPTDIARNHRVAVPTPVQEGLRASSNRVLNEAAALRTISPQPASFSANIKSASNAVEQLHSPPIPNAAWSIDAAAGQRPPNR